MVLTVWIEWYTQEAFHAIVVVQVAIVVAAAISQVVHRYYYRNLQTILVFKAVIHSVMDLATNI